MSFGSLVESRGQYRAGNRFPESSNIFRCKINQENQNFYLRIISCDCIRIVLYQFPFPAIRRTEKESALTKSQWGNQINQTHIRKTFPVHRFKRHPAAWIDRGQLIKQRTLNSFFFREAVHCINIKKRGIFIALSLRTYFPLDHVPCAQRKTPNLCHGNIDIPGRRHEMSGPKEAISVRMKFENAASFFKITRSQKFFQSGRTRRAF